MKVLVTGGAGFLGSHLCERLLRDGNSVICLDNFFTGSKMNVQHLLLDDRFRCVQHDLTIPFYEEVDQIYNLASPAAPSQYQENPVFTLQTNVLGTSNVMALAKRLEVPVLQVSTVRVAETVDHLGVHGCYIEGKRCAETIVMEYHRRYKIPVKIVRLFNTYGPRMAVNDSRVIPQFITRGLRGLDLYVYGDGSQTDSFAYVSDVIDSLVTLMNVDSEPGPFYLGGTSKVSILQLAELVSKMLPTAPRIAHTGTNTLTRDILYTNSEYWHETVTLNDGLQKTVGYFAGVLNTG